MVEDAVIGEIRRLVRTPEIAARMIEALSREGLPASEAEVAAALGNFDELWVSLFPAEQARIIHLLVERVTIGANGITVDLRNDGLASIVRDMIIPAREKVPS